MKYLAQLSTGRMILWCYLIWYLTFAARYFDPSPRLWVSSLGISGIIGAALVISTSDGGTKLSGWQIFRLFLMPFCVSSFAALIKGHGFFLIFPPSWRENLLALGSCAAFCAFIFVVKRVQEPQVQNLKPET
ncbi:MAG TPA: hypothetical protein VIT21_08110 [Chthoniobacterales bacterium]